LVVIQEEGEKNGDGCNIDLCSNYYSNCSIK